MANLETFEMTLKTKWMKRIFARDSDWMVIPKMNGIDKIPQYGPDYLNLLLYKVMNPFWRSFVKAYNKFIENTTLKIAFYINHFGTTPLRILNL